MTADMKNMSEVIEDLKHSLLDPNGNFVVVTPLAQRTETVMLSNDELEAIRKDVQDMPLLRKIRMRREEDDDEEEYDDEYDDDEEDDEDGEVSSKLEKAMTIGGFIIGAIIICILIFFIARAAGLVNIGGTAKDDTQQTEQEEIDDTVDENGQYLTEADQHDRRKCVECSGTAWFKGKQDWQKAQSSEYKLESSCLQETEAGTKVDQGTVINYVVGSGTDATEIVKGV